MRNRREYPRIPKEANVNVKIQSAPNYPVLEGKSLSCKTEDVSFNGLRLCVDTFLPINTFLEMAIVFEDIEGDIYRHTGTVVWVKEKSVLNIEEARLFNVGILLKNPSNPQFNAWKTKILKMLENEYQEPNAG